MEFIRYRLILFFIIFIFSCDKLTNHEIEIIACDRLQMGIIYLNSEMVNSEVNKLVKDLKPVKNDSDHFGHKDNLDKLITRLNAVCDKITAELICYACIYTNPPQSEILVATDSAGTVIYRAIDIQTPNDDILSCMRVHKYYVENKQHVLTNHPGEEYRLY